VTAPVVDAGFLAPIVARLDTLEVSVRLLTEIVDRQRMDVVGIDEVTERLRADLKLLRDAVEGKS
jgi:hypothetical protein